METQKGTGTVEDNMAVSTNLNIILLYNSVRLYSTNGVLFIYFHSIELLLESRSYLEVYFQDSLGSPVVKNLPANAEDMSSIPGPGRFHMPRCN